MKRISYAEQLQQEATITLMLTLIFNMVLLVSGITLISLALGWQVGVGVGLLFMFLKGGK